VPTAAIRTNNRVFPAEELVHQELRTKIRGKGRAVEAAGRVFMAAYFADRCAKIAGYSNSLCKKEKRERGKMGINELNYLMFC